MACVAAVSAVGGVVIVTRPARSEQAVYLKRIAGTMVFAFAIILAFFSWGLDQIGG